MQQVITQRKRGKEITLRKNAGSSFLRAISVSPFLCAKTAWPLFILPALFAFIQHDNTKREKAMTLLTQKEWVLTSYGCDANNNAVIDGPEENILDCEKDNTCCFNANGTGYWLDNSLSCGTGIAEMNFSWQLDEHSTELDLDHASKTIMRLDSDRLILCEKQTKGGKVIRDMVIFEHK
jgi:hypothetical protein